LRRTLKKFEYHASFAQKVLAKDDFVCTVIVLVIEDDFHYYVNSKWIGEGRSKKLSKAAALSKLLSDMTM